MEICFIKVVNGEPEGHPIADWNLRMFYPDLDAENPPEGFEKFIRLAPPELGPFGKSVETKYLRVNGVFQDVHTIIPMSEEEKKQKIEIKKRTTNLVGWTLNEETLEWEPPVPMPIDDKKYYWNNKTQSWVELPLEENQE